MQALKDQGLCPYVKTITPRPFNIKYFHLFGELYEGFSTFLTSMNDMHEKGFLRAKAEREKSSSKTLKGRFLDM